jgi:hypothetical protein
MTDRTDGGKVFGGLLLLGLALRLIWKYRFLSRRALALQVARLVSRVARPLPGTLGCPTIPPYAGSKKYTDWHVFFQAQLTSLTKERQADRAGRIRAEVS